MNGILKMVKEIDYINGIISIDCRENGQRVD